MQSGAEHRRGMSDAEFHALFTTDRPVIFAYHGSPWLIHRLTFGRAARDQFHVLGYREDSGATTPFRHMLANDMDRFHLVMDVINRVPGLDERAAGLRQLMADTRVRHDAWTREHGQDLPEVSSWTWPDAVQSAGLTEARPAAFAAFAASVVNAAVIRPCRAPAAGSPARGLPRAVRPGRMDGRPGR
jgi:xylulose-5-phosphate/fructose-6-phosphate phosphoketolase